MQILANQRREKFAQLVASGASSHAEAYRTVYSNNPKASQANAARLMANDSIAARVEELRAMSATAATLTMQQRREIAAAIARDTTARASDRLAAIVADAQLAGELKREATAAASVTVGVAVKVALSEEERRELMAAKQRAIAAREKRMALEEMAARN